MFIYNNKQTGASAMGQSSVYGPMLCGFFIFIFHISIGKDFFLINQFIYLEGKDILAFFFLH
jgi:hypothetical protein